MNHHQEPIKSQSNETFLLTTFSLLTFILLVKRNFSESKHLITRQAKKPAVLAVTPVMPEILSKILLKVVGKVMPELIMPQAKPELLSTEIPRTLPEGFLGVTPKV